MLRAATARLAALRNGGVLMQPTLLRLNVTQAVSRMTPYKNGKYPSDRFFLLGSLGMLG